MEKYDLVGYKEAETRSQLLITVEKVTKQCRKMPNWKVPGKDGVQGY